MNGMKQDDPTGHITHLSDNRLVFLGQRAGDKDNHYMGFRNRQGDDTFLVFSNEALDALLKMYTTPFKGERCGYPFKVEWRVVKKEAQDV